MGGGKVKVFLCHCLGAECSNQFYFQFSSVQFSHSVMSDSLRPHGLQHTTFPCPSPTPGVYSNSCPLSRWCHPTILSSVIPFSCLQSFPASGSFQMSRFFASGGQSIGVSASASVLPMNIQDWSPLGWTGWISLQSKELSRAFSNITVQKHQFFSTQLTLWSNSHIHTWLLEFLINFYRSIVGLQCCVSFYCTARWISYTYTYTYVPASLDSLPI